MTNHTLISAADIQPLFARVVVQPMTPGDTDGPRLGRVLARGPDASPMLQPGIFVLYGKYSGTTLNTSDGEMRLMLDQDAYAVATVLRSHESRSSSEPRAQIVTAPAPDAAALIQHTVTCWRAAWAEYAGSQAAISEDAARDLISTLTRRLTEPQMQTVAELQAQINRHKQHLADAHRSLRALCEPYGIGDWPEDAHLADAIRHVAKQIGDLVHPELLRPISGPFANRECVILERREGRMRISPISESTWYNLPPGDTLPSPSQSSVADLREALIVELMRTNHSREWSVDMVRRIQAGTLKLAGFHSQEAHRLAAALLLTPPPPDLPYAGPGSPLDE